MTISDTRERHKRFADLRALRIGDLAELLGVSPGTIRKWIAGGKFPPPFFVTGGSPDMWRARDVEAHLEKLKRSRQRRPLRGAAKTRQAAKAAGARPLARVQMQRDERGESDES